MKKIFILIGIASMTFCACNKSEIIENKEAASFVASFDANTKTTLNEDRTQSWLGGEVVKVLDVTDASQDTPVETTCTFTNIGTEGDKATFVADSPNFEFVEEHNYFVYYSGRALNTPDYSKDLWLINSTTLGIKYSNDYSYNPTGTYGLSNNKIPLASKFKYEGKESLQNIIFHNVTNLLVLQVRNQSGVDQKVKKIQIELPDNHWSTRIFGGALVSISKNDDYSKSKSDDYKFAGGSAAQYGPTVSFSEAITIKNEKEEKIAVCCVKPYTANITFNLTANIYDENDTIVASAVKSLTKDRFENGPGRTYVWTIDITGSRATNALNINPLGKNELAY